MARKKQTDFFMFTCINRRRFSTEEDVFSLNDKNLFNVVVVVD